MADDDVSDMLKSWGLESYTDVFKEHGIDISCFALLTDDMLKEIMPMIGDRAKFKANLEEWRNVIALANNQLQFMDLNDSSHFTIEIPSPISVTSLTAADSEVSSLFDNEQYYSSDDVQQSQGSNQSDTTDSINLTEVVQIKDCDLLNYLKSTTEGKALLATHNADGLLDNSGRRKICNLIVRREFQEDPQKSVNTQRLLFLAQEITKVFPKEHLSTYFIPYMNYGPSIKKAAKGKLLDCFNNKRREYKKAGLIISSTIRSPSFENSSASLLLNQTTSETG